MKRAWAAIAGLALALALPAFGQIRGTPASVTSYGVGRGATPGPPASVTSLGPRGFGHTPPANFTLPCSSGGVLIPSAMGCTPTLFTSGHFFPDGRDRGPVNLRPRRNRGFVPTIVVPYPYPVVVAAEPEPEPIEPEPPAPTIFEHRATTQRYVRPQSPRPVEPPAEAAPVPSEPSPAEARAQIPTVLVYRDGHQQEVSNYAIVGTTLYDLGTFVAHKIPLAELNLKATLKANDDRGVEFAVPAGVKVE